MHGCQLKSATIKVMFRLIWNKGGKTCRDNGTVDTGLAFSLLQHTQHKWQATIKNTQCSTLKTEIRLSSSTSYEFK